MEKRRLSENIKMVKEEFNTKAWEKKIKKVDEELTMLFHITFLTVEELEACIKNVTGENPKQKKTFGEY
jgi:hypothetical protein